MKRQGDCKWNLLTLVDLSIVNKIEFDLTFLRESCQQTSSEGVKLDT
jgi:hypothetical protein